MNEFLEGEHTAIWVQCAGLGVGGQRAIQRAANAWLLPCTCKKLNIMATRKRVVSKQDDLQDGAVAQLAWQYACWNTVLSTANLSRLGVIV